MFGTFEIYFIQYFNMKFDQNESKTVKRVRMFLMYWSNHYDQCILTTTNMENASFEKDKYSIIIGTRAGGYQIS
jgi:hypothetical protein